MSNVRFLVTYLGSGHIFQLSKRGSGACGCVDRWVGYFVGKKNSKEKKNLYMVTQQIDFRTQIY